VRQCYHRLVPERVRTGTGRLDFSADRLEDEIRRDRNGDSVAPLQFAQEGAQRGDIATDILIDAVQTHERIEAFRHRYPGFRPANDDQVV
jgi:hypothetical protein